MPGSLPDYDGMSPESHVTTPLVLHVVHQLAMGGMENGLVNLLNRMPPSRFRHAIACIEDYTDFRQRLARPDVDVIALNRTSVGIWAVRRELFRLCRRLRPTIVHSRNTSGLDALLPTLLAGVRHHVHGEHGWDVNDLAGTQWKPVLLRRLHAPFVDRYITVSEHLRHYLIERVRIAPSRITGIYNGVDTERFSPAREKPRDMMPANFEGPDTIVIGTVGRIQAVKDQATLVRAFALLSQRADTARLQLRLAIVGSGPLLQELRALVKSLGIESRTWLPGAAANVPDVMRAFDVFVLPSLSEGISNTILEAMSTGLPVVATAAGGNPELVRDGLTGRLFQPGDQATLMNLLADYAADASLRNEHGRAARLHAVQHFGLSAMVERYQAVYDELCGTK